MSDTYYSKINRITPGIGNFTLNTSVYSIAYDTILPINTFSLIEINYNENTISSAVDSTNIDTSVNIVVDGSVQLYTVQVRGKIYGSTIYTKFSASGTVIPYHYPSKPVITSIVNILPRTILINWSSTNYNTDISPLNGLKSVTYRITNNTVSTGENTILQTTGTPLKIVNLSAGTYDVSISCKNIYDLSSSFSESSTVMVADIPTINSIEVTNYENIIYINYGDTSNNSVIQDFNYSIYNDDNELINSGSTESTYFDISIDNIYYGKTYRIYAYLRSDIGTSLPFTSYFIPSNIPTNIENVNVAVESGNTITIAFDASDNGSAITDVSYNFSIYSTTETNTVSCNDLSNGHYSFYISGLIVGNTYNINFACYNTKGYSVPYRTNNIILNTPSVPQITDISSILINNISHIYIDVDSLVQGTYIVRYNYRVYPDGSYETYEKKLSTQKFTLDISGKLGIFDFYMDIYNYIGYSTVVNAMLFSVPPTQPVIGAIQYGNYIEITYMSYFNSPIDSITYIINGITYTIQSADNPFRISYLPSEQSYAIRIKLHNAYGDSSYSNIAYVNNNVSQEYITNCNGKIVSKTNILNRFELISPYPTYDRAVLDARRKYEILHRSNTVNTVNQRTGLTKKQQYATVSRGSIRTIASVNGDIGTANLTQCPDDLPNYINTMVPGAIVPETVPLYNYNIYNLRTYPSDITFPVKTYFTNYTLNQTFMSNTSNTIMSVYFNQYTSNNVTDIHVKTSLFLDIEASRNLTYTEDIYGSDSNLQFDIASVDISVMFQGVDLVYSNTYNLSFDALNFNVTKSLPTSIKFRYYVGDLNILLKNIPSFVGYLYTINGKFNVVAKNLNDTSRLIGVSVSVISAGSTVM